ncbi:MAG: hypothetical protein WCD89_23805 [Anaerocolumna sp.]
MPLKATEEVMFEEMEYIKKLQPDYIIHDSMSPWGKYMAKLHIFTISVGWS